MNIIGKLRTRLGQGTAEYVLILALVVGLIVILWKAMGPSLQTKIGAIGTGIVQTGQ